jgi:hypothetical protein
MVLRNQGWIICKLMQVFSTLSIGYRPIIAWCLRRLLERSLSGNLKALRLGQGMVASGACTGKLGKGSQGEAEGAAMVAATMSK